MDIVRILTLEYPIETFLFGANWLLERTTPAPVTTKEAGMLISFSSNLFGEVCLQYKSACHCMNTMKTKAL